MGVNLKFSCSQGFLVFGCTWKCGQRSRCTHAMRMRTCVLVVVCVARKLHPCPSYSGRRDCNNCVHWRSLYKGGKRHTMPHSAQSRHTNYWAPRTRKQHQQEHRPQRPTESSDPTQHAKGRTGDRPGPRKGATTRRNVTQGGTCGETIDNSPVTLQIWPINNAYGGFGGPCIWCGKLGGSIWWPNLPRPIQGPPAVPSPPPIPLCVACPVYIHTT